LLLLLAAFSAGCGYSFHGNLPEHIKTVAVPIFKNQSDVPGFENAITSAVISAFSSGGWLRVVPMDPGRREEGIPRTPLIQKEASRP
jgi:hypothetical protein